MKKPKNQKSDVINSIENREVKKPKKKNGKETLTNSINEEVAKMVLKIQQERAFVREDAEIVLGKGGGENLEFYCDDFQNNYDYSTKESMRKKEVKTKTDVLLRPVSEMDEYNEKR
ncbi:hypothetical protein [Planktothrix sp. FACHB-1365]|uniref:hypothetical protein n=1 Tax=Planktothrix sp. FACHB-1365 TaxID=2692855 RepID=UPI00168600C3|nr:hypothetical protein [Planktothrix sp. FACHB-1365]MBD2481538.1 hypothetical protein [Planktothrix sp. FACHB-1365]